jgi:hypothetical protein
MSVTLTISVMSVLHAFNPAGTLFATASSGRVKVFDAVTGAIQSHLSIEDTAGSEVVGNLSTVFTCLSWSTAKPVRLCLRLSTAAQSA